MKKIVLLVAVVIFASCKSHTILYTIKNVESFSVDDSVDIKMIDARAVFIRGEYGVGFTLEITNKNEDSIVFWTYPILELKSDSIVRLFKKRDFLYSTQKIDSTYTLKKGEKDTLQICCYDVIGLPSVSVLRNYWSTKKENHNFILYLDITSADQNKIEKRIVLEPMK